MEEKKVRSQDRWNAKAGLISKFYKPQQEIVTEFADACKKKELAERLQVYPKDISRWENGERTPSVPTFAKICRELNVSADKILELK